MAGDVTRTVRIVYEVEGVEGAAADQQSLERALNETGEALSDQSQRVEEVERSMASLSDVATRSEQVTQRLHQSLQAFAGGLAQVSALMGTETEGGRLLGQMSHFAATGIQLGSAFGPLGGVVGGLAGALLGLGDALTPVVPAIREVTAEANASADAALAMGDAFEGAGDRMRDFVDSVSTASRARGLQDMNARIAEMSDRVATLGGGSAMQRLEAISLRDELASLLAQSAAMQEGLDEEGRETGGGRRGGRGGGSRRDTFRSDGGAALRALAAQGESDASRAERMGRPSEFDVMGADLQRQQRNRGFGGGRGGDPVQAQIAALDQLKDKQQQIHDEQMARIEEQVGAWTEAGQKIGGTLYNAFQSAAAGQESLDVAVVKGFKSLAIQFGGQMVQEGIGALLTAVGNTVANPPLAAGKAAEGAGKLALGIGLGAAGAAIPVPASGGGQQAKTPRLGPDSGSGGGGGSVIVNMNAPSVVTGTRSQVGRELGRALEDAQRRFGRAA